MPIMVISGLCGAGGAAVRSLLGWAKGKDKFEWKRITESVVEGFLAGMFVPEPISAAVMGYAGSSVIGKAIRIPQRKKLPENK